MKVILVLLDGLGDRSYTELKGLTPLQAAHTPNMDRLAAMGANGLYHASIPGECLPSETAHFLLFGYDRREFPGRGLLEAVGDDVPFNDSDVLCLAHLSGVTLKNGVPVLTDGRDEIGGSKKEIGALFSEISPRQIDGVGFALHQTRRNDAVLVISGDVSPDISDSDPITRGKPMGRIAPLDGSAEPERAARTAAALNRYLSFCYRRLTDPEIVLRKPASLKNANFLATQRCGRRRVIEPFPVRWGLRAQVIASVSLLRGLAHEVGMDFVRMPDGSDPGSDLRQRIRIALSDDSHDFFHVHTKTPDEAGHKGSAKTKKNVIAALDRGMDELARAVAERDDLLVIVTSDHSTPCDSPLVHSGECVPLTMAGSTARMDRIDRFDEISAATGCLGLLRGGEVMRMVLNLTNRAALAGHHMGNRIRPYVSDDYAPFVPEP